MQQADSTPASSVSQRSRSNSHPGSPVPKWHDNIERSASAPAFPGSDILSLDRLCGKHTLLEADPRVLSITIICSEVYDYLNLALRNPLAVSWLRRMIAQAQAKDVTQVIGRALGCAVAPLPAHPEVTFQVADNNMHDVVGECFLSSNPSLHYNPLTQALLSTHLQLKNTSSQ